MVVDDDPVFTMLINQLVKLHTTSVECATYLNPFDASSMVNHNPPHVLFLDINIPEMNGCDFLNQLKDGIEEICDIYIVTSSVDKNDEAKALSFKQVKGFVSKPLTGSVFKSLINKL